MEIMNTTKKVLAIFESVICKTGLTEDMKLKDILQSSLSLMQIIVAIEKEFNIFLDDIDFIEIYNLDIQGLIHHAKLK
jgi:acyl carrier protein